MRKLERIKTGYKGVFYYNVLSTATGKTERIYYIRYRRDGKEVEEPCGRQYQDDMTPRPLWRSFRNVCTPRPVRAATSTSVR